jgi:hypothetical protein
LNGQQCYDNIIYGILEQSGYSLHWAGSGLTARVVTVDKKATSGLPLNNNSNLFLNMSGSTCGCGSTFRGGHEDEDMQNESLKSFTKTSLA